MGNWTGYLCSREKTFINVWSTCACTEKNWDGWPPVKIKIHPTRHAYLAVFKAHLLSVFVSGVWCDQAPPSSSSRGVRELPGMYVCIYAVCNAQWVCGVRCANCRLRTLPRWGAGFWFLFLSGVWCRSFPNSVPGPSHYALLLYRYCYFTDIQPNLWQYAVDWRIRSENISNVLDGSHDEGRGSVLFDYLRKNTINTCVRGIYTGCTQYHDNWSACCSLFFLFYDHFFYFFAAAIRRRRSGWPFGGLRNKPCLQVGAVPSLPGIMCTCT